ncbi:AMP-binding protein [Pseudonocardia sp. KRD-188]|uniref:AMP-binding protein n=1 Tax=Pseudonocardia oceani TaxID=2792013 RepID=UPI001C4A3498|nr:AMP-binding protein [Pseudonocardia oceani]MBW0093100.1 AMP-binding protein [Pseudonocardia oceani]
MVVGRVWTGVRAAADEAVGSAVALRELGRAGLIGPVRPDRLARMATAAVRYRLTVTAGYEAGAARHPDRAAIVDDDGRLTFGELHERTDRIAQALAADGVVPGTRVGVLCRNHRGPVEAQIATGKLGADVVLFNTGMSAGQRASVVDELGVHTLLADEEFTDLPDTCRVVRDLSGLIAAVLGSIPLRAGEPVHIAAPLLHTWGHAALQLAMLLGSPVVLARTYEPERFLQIAGGCDAVFAVPVMLQRLLEQDLDGPMARVVAVSGSALPAGLATAFLDRYGDRLYNLYGSTEVSWVSIAGPEDLRAAPGTAGRAPLGTRLAVLDEHGEEVPTGVEGRVFVGNDMPFEGYTREGADVERHGDLMGTGDVGRVDEHGRLHLTGRADDMIVSGGENVHPGPVEDLIVARAEVREAAVTGVDDDEYGQRLAAYVVLEPGATADADTVRGWVRAELSRFAVPRDVVFLDELPRNATGKVVHRELAG